MTIWGGRETNGNACIIGDNGNIAINCNDGSNYNGKVLTKDTDDAIKHFAKIADVNIGEFKSYLQEKIDGENNDLRTEDQTYFRNIARRAGNYNIIPPDETYET